jgi:hypothetical protein
MKAGDAVAGQMPAAHDDGMEQPRPSNEQILQQLGAAVLRCWDDLSFQSQTRILDQGDDDIIGLAPMPEARNEIAKRLLRHRTQGFKQ